ncbi:MAG: zf-TFIIB domain-containing protein [Myxococcota bacterium]
MDESDLRGIAVRICRECRSILMTRADLRVVLGLAGRTTGARRPTGPSGFFDRIKGKPTWVKSTASLRCPECRYNMYEVQNHGIVVDFCLNCESVWFDEGELNQALAVSKERGGLKLIPEQVGKNETAEVIAYMLDTLTTE